MLATLIKEPFDDPDWIFETKWDGYRAIAIKTKKVQIFSRNQKIFNDRFPSIVQELEELAGKWILDGEIVIFDKKGISQFQLLQNYEEGQKGIPYYVIFDILSYQGKDLRKIPLIERKQILRAFLAQKKSKHLHFSEHFEQFGKKLFQEAKKRGWEGIVAKRKESTYLSKRSRDWLKIKTGRRQEFVIGGYTQPRGARKYFGALLIGVYEKGRLIYTGHVGGGFNGVLLETTYKQLQKLACKNCPFQKEPEANAPVTWIEPKLVCEVAFSEWTKEGMLRQPIFQGLRIDKDPKSIFREKV